MSTKVSVIVPTYNNAKYLDKCLNSLVKQTLREIEIIVIDDCSDDNTKEVLEKFRLNDNRIKIVLNKKNMSQHYSRKLGVSLARGEYILFVDSDDWLDLNACSVLYYESKNRSLELLEFGYIEHPSKNVRMPPKISDLDRFSEYLKEKPGISHVVWNKMYLTKLLKTAFLNMSDEKIPGGQDLYESVVISYYASSSGTLNEALYNYQTGIGVSQKVALGLLELEGYLESLSKVVISLKGFFRSENIESSLQGLEKHLLNYSISHHIIKRTREEDRGKAILLLINYFNSDIIEERIKKHMMFLEEINSRKSHSFIQLLKLLRHNCRKFWDRLFNLK